MTSKVKKIVFVIANDFPEGNTKNTRIKAYAKALKSIGYSVEIWVGFSSKFNETDINKAKSGVWQEIPFRFFSPDSRYPKGFFLKTLYWVYSNISLGLTLLRSPKSFQFIFYTPTTLGLFPAFLCTSIFRSDVNSLVTERFSLSGNSIRRNLYAFEEKCIAVFSSKIIAITHSLEQYYSSIGKRKKVFKIAPIVVDFGRFTEAQLAEPLETLGYVGSFAEKDGVNTMLEAFKIARKKYPNLSFNLMGHSDKSLEGTNINYLGQFEYDRLPELLLACDTLILNRTTSEFSSTGFPIKLAEYLATGIPVVCCDLPEIRNYCDDTELIFFEADNLNSLSNALIWRYQNFEKANAIGRKGRNRCRALFDADIIGEELNNIFEPQLLNE